MVEPEQPEAHDQLKADGQAIEKEARERLLHRHYVEEAVDLLRPVSSLESPGRGVRQLAGELERGARESRSWSS